MRLSSVVLPAPRNPVRMVTGTIWLCSMREAILPSSAHHEQPLEVVAFRKFERHRMIGRGAEALEDLGLRARIHSGAGDDRLEELGAHAARAGEGGEQPAG